ncbi:bifunctional protein-serine/threonine kinase/phosphatase [Aestuariibacter sp. A3R04]|uniref:bifunctional protein-serine/threonine kinase/phosphatase n=1 Tax=Aestuariibacter sp. A3R04 TaxID=2841571 RepID=UPI001C086D66|nr:bifunctional protein-serine/threonine kinase/phosphatase [Aestuariibacter sp. A3R04]MBU3021063.1 bifunctional protein-serine/threonine kinase/phosphatase [Aestuariibacter sp. A3R04]
MLTLSVGQFSSAGEKTQNQDSIGACVPTNDRLDFKGACVLLADGISSSDVSHIASQVAVRQFLDDYYCTSDTLSVPRAALQVIQAINRWLVAQTRESPFNGERDKGYVCTFSALVLRRDTAYLFHIGDACIFRLRDTKFEVLTRQHRHPKPGSGYYLSNALGMHETVVADTEQLSLQAGDGFVLATDGVYEHIDQEVMQAVICKYRDDPQTAANALVNMAFEAGSDDNLSVQVVWVESTANEPFQIGETSLAIPPVLSPLDTIDAFTVLRAVYHSARSHVYLVRHNPSGREMMLKAPSVEMAHEAAFLSGCCMEEWVMRRINSQYVVGAPSDTGPRTAFYTLSQRIRGVTLAQWLADNPAPDLETIRQIVEQVAKGLMALHRKDVIHQDIRPENIMVNDSLAVVLIDLGSASVAGLNSGLELKNGVPGTPIYAAPEYFLGQGGSERSEQFSLAVLTYYLLSGRYPYGANVAKALSISAQKKLVYRSVLDPKRNIPFWLDHTLKKALNPDPGRRYDALSEFIYDLRHPNPAYVSKQRPPLLERNPVAFWQGVSGVLLILIVVLITERFVN